MEKFNKMQEIAGLEIRQKITLDGIKFFLDDSLTSLLIRKSGTEPLLRFYVESDSNETLEKVKTFVNTNT